MIRLSILALIACLLALAKLAHADVGTTLEQTRAGETAALKVLWVASEGWAQLGEDGQPEGLTIAVMQRFADWLAQEHELSVDLDFVEEGDWRRFYDRVRDGSGGVFGLGNVTITEARRDELAFSPPYVTNVAVLISRAGDAEISSASALPEIMAGRTGLGFAGTLHEERLRELAASYWPEMPLELGHSNDELIQAAAAGTHFAYVDGYNYYRARSRGLEIRRHPALDDPGEQFGIIMPLDNDWQDLLDDFFAAHDGLRRSRWYQDAMRHYLGVEIAELLTN
ncbi:MAG: transporter substrate-binding domain-containing protein [Wenzhouxiangella sp.]|nr:transporter substrate-binding domain-containing protein [Wenzhouxiangella sp.]MCH8477897.1 transporter substrate-binding domain-containing protein [Wenzhouxiangella sp.]TVR94237.1 MAG: amino acid ABC transporter substrate-binding protein [Wenzhouxiangellaceae bacterium]